MAELNYEKFVSDLIRPIVMYPEEVRVKIFAEDNQVITLQVMVNEKDLGRVIGKKGRVANAIRTIAFACGAREGKKIEISIDSF
ncbi:MAG: KH domain-containing protein [Bacilli bacterium]|nr:KH domain-containing protein [Bacilli bacterium]MDY0063675.1 KH domain-containing protein [Bacilli bacterium]